MSGRGRVFKHEILEDEKTAGLDDYEFRFFTALILLADDYGNVRGAPEWVANIVWWKVKPSRDPRETLEQLLKLGLVSIYHVKAQPYVHITGWEKHQKVDHPSRPKIPGPDQQDPEPNPTPTEPSRDPRETLEKSSLSRAYAGSGSGVGVGSINPLPPSERAKPEEGNLFPVEPASGVQTKAKPARRRASKSKTKLPDQMPLGYQNVQDCYESQFKAKRGRKPILTDDSKADICSLIDMMGNADGACATIREAFEHEWWGSRVTITDIVKNPDRFGRGKIVPYPKPGRRLVQPGFAKPGDDWESTTPEQLAGMK